MRLWQDVRCRHWMPGQISGFLVVVVLTLLSGVADGSQPPVAAGQDSRPFRMGFTAFPHDITPQAVEETRQFVRANADLIAHHIEGVPWTEALREEPFSKELLGEYESKRSMKPPGAKVYLAVSPGRGDLKLPDKGAAPLAPS